MNHAVPCRHRLYSRAQSKEYYNGEPVLVPVTTSSLQMRAPCAGKMHGGRTCILKGSSNKESNHGLKQFASTVAWLVTVKSGTGDPSATELASLPFRIDLNMTPLKATPG